MNRVPDRMLDRVYVPDAVGLILAVLLSKSQVVPGPLQFPGLTRDPKDDPLMACAVEGAADHLVSGDRDLLDLGEADNSRMVTPREFVEVLGL